MKLFIKRTLFLATSLVVLSSCAKEEFSPNKGKQSASTSEAITTSAKLCSQSTLISPKVDILMLWDNTTSFNFVTPETKASMTNLINTVSEKFDYHILAAPLVPVGSSSTSGSLIDAKLIVKNNDGLNNQALSIVTSKEAAVANLSFNKSYEGSSEAGVSRTIAMLQNNVNNGIFRQGAYTIIVVISNEDEKLCQGCDSDGAYNDYINPKITQLLNIRGNTLANPSSTGLLNSSMMRFINISNLTADQRSCRNKTGGSVNSMYKKTAKAIYNAEYSNLWPRATDHLSPDLPGFPDSYNLCNISFSHIFDGVNTAIKETLIKHKYDYWPMASLGTSVDPDSVRVVRSDGKLLTNRAVDSSVSNGYEVVVNSDGEAVDTTINTRYAPTAGEPFSGKLIRLFGTEGNDKIVYPDCLTVTYTAVKSTYGYIYLKNGEPSVDTIQVLINGQPVPKSSTNGWDYMGMQFVNSLDSNLKVVDLTSNISSGYFIRLNGTYKMKNNVSNTFTVYYTSKAK